MMAERQNFERQDVMHFKLPVIKAILWLGLLVAVALFVTQNAQVVELRFLVWRLAMSESLLLSFVLAVGFGLGWLFHAFVAWKRAQRRLRRLNREANQENNFG